MSIKKMGHREREILAAYEASLKRYEAAGDVEMARVQTRLIERWKEKPIFPKRGGSGGEK